MVRLLPEWDVSLRAFGRVRTIACRRPVRGLRTGLLPVNHWQGQSAAEDDFKP